MVWHSVCDCGISSFVGTLIFQILMSVRRIKIIETQHEISNNVLCATSKASDQPAHTRSLVRAFASRLIILRV